MANAYLRRLPASRVLKLELEPVEVEVCVLPPEDEGGPLLEDLSEEEKEAEAKRLKLLKWVMPKKGAERERFEEAKRLSAKESARRSALPDVPRDVLTLGARWQPLQSFLKSQAHAAGAPDLAGAIGGGREVGTDMGHGYPRLLRPESVAAIAGALEAVEPPTDPALAGPVLRLAGFYRAAADAGEGILFYQV